MRAYRRMFRRRKMTALASARRHIQSLSPYLSLLLLSVPVILVEPLKIVSLLVASKGHWLTGTGIIIGAYALSLFFVERLFRAVKPKLLMLGWFAKLWTLFTTFRNIVIQMASGRRSSTDQELRPNSPIATDPAQSIRAFLPISHLVRRQALSWRRPQAAGHRLLLLGQRLVHEIF